MSEFLVTLLVIILIITVRLFVAPDEPHPEAEIIVQNPPKPTAYLLAEGYDWNPLRQYRNLECPCGSKKKSKRCHGRHETLPIEDVARVKEWLNRRTT